MVKPKITASLSDDISPEKKIQLSEAGYNATLAYFHSEEGQSFLEKSAKF